MNIIIVGEGKLGSTLAKRLSFEGHSIVTVDKEENVLKKAQEKRDIICVHGNGASVDVLTEAGAETADLLIACAAKDELNILCCLVAKKLGTKHTIARVRSPEYIRHTELLKDDLGLSMTINPNLAAANEISRLLIIPDANKVELFAKGRVELVEYTLPEGSPLDSLKLTEFYSRLKIKMLVCAVCRDGKVHIPNGSFEIKAGDVIYISAEHSQIMKFFRMMGHGNEKVENVIISGGGLTGYYLAKKLLSMGMRVKIIEKNRDTCRELCEKLPKATVINCDGTDRDMLLEEGYDKADAFVALTGDDEDNLVSSVFAKNDGCSKIITKLSHNLSAFMSFGIDCAVSPQTVVSDNVASYVRAMANSEADSNVETLYELLDGKAEAVEFILKDKTASYLGTPISKLRFKKDMLVACIARRREIIIPGGNDCFEAGDSVVVVTASHRFTEFADIFDR